MTRERIYTLIAAITTTLLETGGTSPASMIYLALGMNIQDYNDIVSIMRGSGLVTTTSDTVSLTSRGEQFAHDCNEVLSKK
jgi:predicted transcriptional regulator